MNLNVFWPNTDLRKKMQRMPQGYLPRIPWLAYTPMA